MLSWQGPKETNQSINEGEMIDFDDVAQNCSFHISSSLAS